MSRFLTIRLLALTLFLCDDLVGQDYSDPVFGSFKGKMYHLPLIKQKTKHGYKVGVQEFFSDTVYSYRVMEEVELASINVQERDSRDGFPGYEKYTSQFGFLLHSEVSIEDSACYEFSLTSDDGSRLWIDNQLVINNDGSHGMKLKKDSVVLHSGSYEARLWYFQGYPTQMGIILDYKAIGPPSNCPISDEIVTQKKVVIESKLFFDVAEYDLKPEAEKTIQQIISNFDGRIPKTISVIGHTDSKGSEDYNQKLSLQRAMSLVEILQKQKELSETIFKAIGKGSTVPIAENTTVYGRKQNRRVELEIQF